MFLTGSTASRWQNTLRVAIEVVHNTTALHMLVDSAVRCFKLLEERLMAREFDRQIAELPVRVAVLNRFTRVGTPLKVAKQ
jgi:hypothetical protein